MWLKMKKISFVIPCYNSEKYVGKTVNELLKAIEADLGRI